MEADVLPLRKRMVQVVRGLYDAAVDPSSAYAPPVDDNLGEDVADAFRGRCTKAFSG